MVDVRIEDPGDAPLQTRYSLRPVGLIFQCQGCISCVEVLEEPDSLVLVELQSKDREVAIAEEMRLRTV